MKQQKTNAVTPKRLIAKRVAFLLHRIAILENCISEDVGVVIKKHKEEIKTLNNINSDILKINLNPDIAWCVVEQILKQER